MMKPYRIEDCIENAFETAVCNEIDHLQRMALWYTGNKSDAEDLTQDTLILALRFRDTYRRGSNLRAWLFKVMRNRHISLSRRRRLEHRVYESESAHALKDWSLSETGRRSTGREGGHDADDGFSDSVARAMDMLKPEFKEAVFLCDIEECTYNEAAMRASCPVGTIMSRLHRGRRALRDKLGSRRALDAA